MGAAHQRDRQTVGHCVWRITLAKDQSAFHYHHALKILSNASDKMPFARGRPLLPHYSSSPPPTYPLALTYSTLVMWDNKFPSLFKPFRVFFFLLLLEVRDTELDMGQSKLLTIKKFRI